MGFPDHDLERSVYKIVAIGKGHIKATDQSHPAEYNFTRLSGSMQGTRSFAVIPDCSMRNVMTSMARGGSIGVSASLALLAKTGYSSSPA